MSLPLTYWWVKSSWKDSKLTCAISSILFLRASRGLINKKGNDGLSWFIVLRTSQPSFCFQRKKLCKCKMGALWAVGSLSASPLFWVYSPVQVTLLPYACFFNLTELPQAVPPEVCAHSKWLASAVDTYCLGSLLTFWLAWGPPMSQHPFDITYRDQLLWISMGALALKVWIPSGYEGLVSMQGGYESLGSMPLPRIISIIFQLALNV